MTERSIPILPGRILVTGGTGFIGSRLVSELQSSGHQVRVLARSAAPLDQDVEVCQGNIENPSCVNDALSSVDTVFHLAGKVHDLESLDAAEEHLRVTVRGTENLVKAAVHRGTRRIVFFSSLSVYDSSKEVRDESAPCRPMSAYGKAKLEAERLLLGLASMHDVHVVCLRPASVYGRDCKGNLPRMIRMIDRGLFPPLRETGARRSMVHVSDLVMAAIAAASNPCTKGQCYIVTDAHLYTLRQLYESICRALDRSIPRWSVPSFLIKGGALLGDVIGEIRGKRFVFDTAALEKLIEPACFSSEKIARDLGYSPKCDFDGALPEMVARYKRRTV